MMDVLGIFVVHLLRNRHLQLADILCVSCRRGKVSNLITTRDRYANV